MALEAALGTFPKHMQTVSDFANNQQPLRAKVDRQSFDDLKPGYDAAMAIVTWHEALVNGFVCAVADAASSGVAPDCTLLAGAVDCCVLLENQFGGWSNITNRFSWFKRTFTHIRSELSAEIDTERHGADIGRFQSFIGNASCPIGIHLTGPLRSAVKKVAAHESVILQILRARVAASQGGKDHIPTPTQLRPLPYLMYIADGDVAPGSFNVFTQLQSGELRALRAIFRRYPDIACTTQETMAEAAPGATVMVQLALVLHRCPHFTAAMATRWQPGPSGGCRCTIA